MKKERKKKEEGKKEEGRRKERKRKVILQVLSKFTFGVCIGEECGEEDLLLAGEPLQVGPGLLIDDAVQVLLGGRAKNSQDVVQLVQV